MGRLLSKHFVQKICAVFCMMFEFGAAKPVCGSRIDPRVLEAELASGIRRQYAHVLCLPYLLHPQFKLGFSNPSFPLGFPKL